MVRRGESGPRRSHVEGKPKPARLSTAPTPGVLVIDDNPVLLRSLARLLQIYGIEVATARDGREGLAKFRRTSPAVVLTDILMPVQDGFSTIIAMRRERPSVKIIAMSGGTRFGISRSRTIASGADGVLEKPFDVGELVVMIRRYLTPDA